jgi:SAM-dependent methyltransferase
MTDIADQSPDVLPVAHMVSGRTMFNFRSGADAWKKFRNTFLQAYWLWPLVIRDSEYGDLLAERDNRSVLRRLLQRALWFYPRITDAKAWALESASGRDVAAFREIDPFGRSVMALFADIVGDRDSSVVDLGCNSGRHLNEMYRNGFRHLTGVDASGRGLRQFKEVYADTHAAADVHHDLFQRFLLRQADRSFDALYTFGGTIEEVHPSFPMVREICRVTRSLVMCVLKDTTPHARYWVHEFRRADFDLVFCIKPISSKADKGTVEHSTSLFVFRRRTD